MKNLSEENYRKLRKEIEETGFSFAVHVWESQGQLFCLDGHQRIECLRRMYDGRPDPLVPVLKVAALDFKEAKRKCLAAASQYGEFNLEGIQAMLKDASMLPAQAAAQFHFPTVDLSVLMNQNPAPKQEPAPDPGTPEQPDINRIVLYYNKEEYAQILAIAGPMMEENQIESMSDLFKHLLDINA